MSWLLPVPTSSEVAFPAMVPGILSREDMMEIALDLFKDAKECRTYAPGETIFVEGEPGDLMYVILDGEVEIRSEGAVLNILSRGDIFGEMALVDDSPRSASATARTSCEIVPVDRYNFLFYVEHSPFFALQVMSVMAKRLRQQIGQL